MQPGRPSQTLLGAAIRRAQHQLLDIPLILNDPIAVRLVPEAEEPGILPEFGANSEQISALFRALFAMRSRYAEDRLAVAARRGVRQYVMIGAGLDTFPWRQPDFARDMQIFAVDHRASLAWTHHRLRECGLGRPSNLVHVPIDLRKESVSEQLAACGFNLDAPGFCSLLGVTQYIHRPSIDTLFRFVGSLKATSEIVFSFVPPDDELDGLDFDIVLRTEARASRLGEPWTMRLQPRKLMQELNQIGFADVFHLTPQLAQLCYFAGRPDRLRAPKWEQMIAAIV
jgi:methyltransferase (TIGR00027 family)